MRPPQRGIVPAEVLRHKQPMIGFETDDLRTNGAVIPELLTKSKGQSADRGRWRAAPRVPQFPRANTRKYLLVVFCVPNLSVEGVDAWPLHR